MAQKPISMEQLKQVLQLYRDGIAIREIARRTGVSRNSIRKYLSRLNNCSATSDQEMAEQAYCNDLIELEAERLRQLSNHFNEAGDELSKTGVTRRLLWQEYLNAHPDGYSYSRYCFHLERFLKNKDVAMHLEYEPADMIMIDFAGKKLHYTDMSTGELIKCEVFVAILPFSGLIFCKAVHSQQTSDFMECINSMLKYYGGAPSTILCDNLKTAVTRPDRYEPVFTDVCDQLSEHYSTTFSATRPYRPRDKALVERAVNIIYNNVYGPLRNTDFISLVSLNAAIADQLVFLNNKTYKNTPYSRFYYFDTKEKSLLKQLPSEPFSIKKTVTLTVQRNYHIQLSEDHRYFSVPYQYVGKKVKVLYDAKVVEIYLGFDRIAVHTRNRMQKAYSTLAEHMPPHHQHMHQIKGWNKEDLLSRASCVGKATLQAATLMLQNSIYIEQNYKACFGMLMLQKKYTAARLEAACSRALQGTRVNYTMIKNILERRLDTQMMLTTVNPIPHHDNIRGKQDYQ